MLSYPFTEFLGYEDGESVLCRPCAVARFNTVLVERCEAGLSDRLNPLIRYAIEEGDTERDWKDAERRVDRLLDEHPAIALDGYDKNELTGRVARARHYESCEECGRRLAPPLKKKLVRELLDRRSIRHG